MGRKALLLLSLAALPAAFSAAAALAAPTEAQRLFRKQLLEDRSVSADIKTRLRKGGFVDRRVIFTDLTGDDRSDAVVQVHSGGSAGRIALYVFSAGRDGEDLGIVYRNQRLYRVNARVSRTSRLLYRTPVYETGDELCCPAAERETELRWDARANRFRVADRRTIQR